MKSCPWVVRRGGRTEPVAEILTVDCSCDANVLAVLAAVGPLDDDLDEADELRPGRLVVINDSHAADERLFRAPCLCMLCPLAGKPCFPLQKEKCIGQSRSAVSPAPPQSFGQGMATHVGVHLVRPPEGRLLILLLRSQRPREVPQLVEPVKSGPGIPPGRVQMRECRRPLSGILGYEAERPAQSCAPGIGLVAIRPCPRRRPVRHAGDHLSGRDDVHHARLQRTHRCSPDPGGGVSGRC
ncbi:hypothetical protein GA0115254_1088224 [Streptomyces sp. Ncost-T10-10d]|nr:hypothetical protein GA0115254_1088224 [Streptomyces sp. Ncost-T10-10d]